MAAYEQVAETIRREIRAGERRVGDKLPNHRALAERHRVSLGTAQRAVKLLQDEGWLVSRPSVGVFVSEPPEDAVSVADLAGRLTELETVVADLRERIMHIEHQPS